MTYTWTQTAGTSVTLTGADTATPSFTPSVADTYTFQLVVNNGAENSFPDGVMVNALEAGTEEAAIATTFQNLNAAFQAYMADPTPENMNAIMAYFSASFLEDGMNLVDLRADFEEFLPNTTLFQMSVSNIQVDGTTATGVVTEVTERYNDWGEPETEFDNWTLPLVKEGDTWKAYGNQNLYDVWVETITRSDGTFGLERFVGHHDLDALPLHQFHEAVIPSCL